MGGHVTLSGRGAIPRQRMTVSSNIAVGGDSVILIFDPPKGTPRPPNKNHGFRPLFDRSGREDDSVIFLENGKGETDLDHDTVILFPRRAPTSSTNQGWGVHGP